MRIFKGFRDLSLIATAMMMSVGAILAIYFHTGFLTITSRSMEPTIKAGDMVLTSLVPRDDIRVRDIVVLPIPENPELNFSHRIISVEKGEEGLRIRTKGDGNPNPDNWSMEVTSKDVTQVLAVIPTAKIFNGPLERKWIFYGLFYGGALLALYGAWRLVKK